MEFGVRMSNASYWDPGESSSQPSGITAMVVIKPKCLYTKIHQVLFCLLDWTNPIPKWSSPHCSPQELTTTKQFDERKSQITYLWIKRIILKDLFGSHIYVIFPSNSLAFWLIRITLVSLLHKCLWSQNQRVCFESLNFLDLRMTPQVVLSCCYRI